VPGLTRSARHYADGSVTVAVVVRDRPWLAVVADLVDGFCLVNAERSQEVRELLWRAVEDVRVAEAAVESTGLRAVPPAA
jgi:hypothetical protein